MPEKLFHLIASVFGCFIAAIIGFIASVFGLHGTSQEIHYARVTCGILTLCLLAACGAFYLTGPLQAILVTVAVILSVMTLIALGSLND